jgi:PAS domain S-box-containing protein
LQVHQIELEMQNEELSLAKTAIEESRARFSDLYDFAPVGYVTIDDKGIVLEANLTVSRLTGFDRGFLLNKPFHLFIVKEDKDAFLVYFKRLTASEASMTLEAGLVKKDKTFIHAQFECISFKEKVKSSQQYLLAILDVTKRRDAEKALEESEKNYRQIVELAQEGIWVIDDRDFTTFVNPAMERMLGYTPGTMLGKHLFDFRDGREIEITKQSLKLRKQGIIQRRDMELIHADGSRIYTTMAASPIIDDKGNYLGAVAVITDITKRKKMEDEIRRNKARLERLLKISQYKAKSNQDLLDFALDEAIDLTRSRIGYIYLYDDTKKEFTLNTWSKCVMQECAIAEPQTKYLLEKTGIWGETVRQTGPIIVNDFNAPNPLKKGYPEGHITLRKFLTVPVVLEGRIVGVVGVANKDTDYDDDDALQLSLLMDSAWKILERNRIQELLRIHSEKLVFANKELEAFGYSVSHDLRNPLHSINACLKVIAVDSESILGKGSVKALGYIAMDIEQMSQIISDLLSLSKVTRQEIQRERIDLSDIAQQIFAELNSSVPARDIEFVVHPDAIVHADKGLMKIMLGNLIANAWKYTGTRKKALIEFGLQAVLHPATYFIRDNGVGFDMARAKKLFQPFQRLHSDKEFKGSGIGLSIVKRILEKHGGTIWVESEKEKGATFFFRLG